VIAFFVQPKIAYDMKRSNVKAIYGTLIITLAYVLEFFILPGNRGKCNISKDVDVTFRTKHFHY